MIRVLLSNEHIIASLRVSHCSLRDILYKTLYAASQTVYKTLYATSLCAVQEAVVYYSRFKPVRASCVGNDCFICHVCPGSDPGVHVVCGRE